MRLPESFSVVVIDTDNVDDKQTGASYKPR